MKIKFTLLFLILIIFPLNLLLANDLKLSIGPSISYLKINDLDFYVNNKQQVSGLNVGLSYELKPVVITVITNRFFNLPISNQLISKLQRLSFESRTKIIADSFLVGYRIDRFIPQIFITNANIDKKLYRDNKFLGETKKSAFLYGFNLSYFYERNLSFSAAILAPNREFGLETGFILGVNYNFNLL